MTSLHTCAQWNSRGCCNRPLLVAGLVRMELKCAVTVLKLLVLMACDEILATTSISNRPLLVAALVRMELKCAATVLKLLASMACNEILATTSISN